MNLPDVQVTDNDRMRFPNHPDGAIRGKKILFRLNDHDLKTLPGNLIYMGQMRKHINPETKPRWLLHRVADELLRRSLINPHQHGQMLNQ